jgi:hypothetical protein
MVRRIEIPEHKFRIRIVLFSFEQQIKQELMRNEINNNEMNSQTMNKINEQQITNK